MQRQIAIIDPKHIPAEFFPLIEAVCGASIELAGVIAKGPLGQSLNRQVGKNSDGDGQKALDVLADEMFATALADQDVRWYASEEQDEVIALKPGGRFAFAIDPLDGSSNIDANVSIGTIFAVFEAKDGPDESFLRSASEQIAAGYVIYGPQTCLVVTFGAGTMLFVLDADTDSYLLADPAVKLPNSSVEYAINASNYRHWSKPMRAFIDDCVAGSEGPRGRDFNMRWVASLVAETHRILTRGGIFLYPSDNRPGYEQGRLRMVYECAPIAFLIEQAGGKATDGCDPILKCSAATLHARTPLVFGSPEKVNRVSDYHNLPDKEVSALFGNRGLFRA